VLDEVLDGALRNEETLIQQARRLGHDLSSPHGILIVEMERIDLEEIRNRISDALTSVRLQALWRAKDGLLEIVISDQSEAERHVSAIRHHVPLVPLVAAVGPVDSGLVGLQRSRQKARQALTIQRRLGTSQSIARYEELGVFRLLFAAESLPEFDDFHDETLGTLVHYDQAHKSDLVETLRAFFDANGSPKDAAQRMGVHRNTVLYRLDRISTLTGFDLNDAATRLRLHLALSMNAIKSSQDQPARASSASTGS
jgi:purine catabolism regulator